MELARPIHSLARLYPLRFVARPRILSPVCSRCLHTSSTRAATPLAHPTTPGPPPDPPAPAVSEAQNRVARKLKQAELLRRGQALRAKPTKSTSVLQKRFWQDVSVIENSEGYQIMLDSRPVRTPSKDILTVPANKNHLALAIALEWDQLVSAQQATKHHYIPLTSLTSRAIDIQKADEAGSGAVRKDIVSMAMRYLSTDTLLCWAPEKNLHDTQLERREDTESLRQIQIRISMPIIGYLTSRVWPGVEIRPILDPDSIMPLPQPDMTKEVIKAWLQDLPAYELAGLERAVLASKSLLVGVRLVVEWSEAFQQLRQGDDGQARFGIEEAAEAASLEVQWQTRMWGEVEDTHDVEKEDMRRQLGSTILLINGTTPA